MEPSRRYRGEGLQERLNSSWLCVPVCSDSTHPLGSRSAFLLTQKTRTVLFDSRKYSRKRRTRRLLCRTSLFGNLARSPSWWNCWRNFQCFLKHTNKYRFDRFHEQVQLIAIDSIAYHFRQFTDMIERSTKLNEAISYLTAIANRLQCTVNYRHYLNQRLLQRTTSLPSHPRLQTPFLPQTRWFSLS